ncbi:MAG: hypothetical protein VZQ80_00510 [Lachnospiraceae bacterium]|nr:hypothetical protein [Lachnospiraceae bacterium]
MFGKSKSRKKEELDERFEEVYKEIHAIDDWDDPRKIEHYILDSCEQIITLTKEVEGEKKQLSVINSYISDVEKIEGLPPKDRREIAETASKVTELTKSRDTYQKKDKKVTDSVFALMQQYDDTMPSEIVRMQNNENYQEKVKRDMAVLEGERGEARYDIDESRQREKYLGRFSILALIVFATIFFVLMVLKTQTEMVITTYMLFYLIAGGAAGLFIFLRQSSLRKERRKRIREMNQITGLLNSVRVKYATVTRALESEKQRFEVGSSYELNYKWEAYLAAVREQEQYMADNEDLEYFSGKLLRLLSPLKLFDRKIWLSQPAALVKDSDLKSVKQELIARREKVTAEIKVDTESVRSERDEINRLMREHDYYVPEIMEIIHSVDKLCGLTGR